MTASRVMGAHQGIHKRNLIYHIIYPYTRIFFFHYYGRVQIRGKKSIPRNQPVIFAPNHQNALMDALIVLFSAPQDVVFLARADIFNKNLMAFLLNSLKILPVFRQRDGTAELGKNADIFDISVNVLKNKHYLCIMPEGSHGDQRKLRTIVKGIFRIAFQAQEEAGSEPFVKIVPVGIDFGDYVKHNASLFINYGKPIEVSEYWEQYRENSAKAINAMKTRLADELRPLMIDIQNEEYYDEIYALKGIYNRTMRMEMGIRGNRLSDQFKADKELIDRLDKVLDKAAEKPNPRIDSLMNKVKRYEEGLKKMNIRDWVVARRGYGMMRTFWRFLALLVTFPLYLYGLINNVIPYYLPVWLVRNIKDRQFHASVKAGLGILVLFPVIHGIQTLLVGLFTGPWWIWVAYMFSLFPTGKFALWWAGRFKKTVRGRWFRMQILRNKPAALKLLGLRKMIKDETSQLVCM